MNIKADAIAFLVVLPNWVMESTVDIRCSDRWGEVARAAQLRDRLRAWWTMRHNPDALDHHGYPTHP